MKSLQLILGITAAALLLTFTPDHSGAQSKPIQVALWTPVQIYGETRDIRGLRINLIYGLNRNVTGIDVGISGQATGDFAGWQFTFVGMVDGAGKGLQTNLLASVTGRDFVGWQYGGLFNMVGGDCQGLQTALYNGVGGRFKGIDIGVINHIDDATGILWGGVNVTDRMVGVQVSLFNYTKQLDGLQVGLLNIAKNAGWHKYFPLVNWKF